MFILTETELYAPDYNHQEEFETLESAQERMKELYHSIAIEGNHNVIERAELNERSALIVGNDGNEIEWDISEK